MALQLGGPLVFWSAGLTTRLHFYFLMYLRYLDDSGSASNANEEYLVLGGICVFEAQVHYLTQELDAIAQRINPSDPDSVEFHASAVYAGRMAPCDRLSRD